ncbi:MAG: hypothetical protein GF355_04335 [Candidatus Eisenbacteria bacterium]|nr:hypothetical protein [Candidatus Eisenbacteria bacterium]
MRANIPGPGGHAEEPDDRRTGLVSAVDAAALLFAWDLARFLIPWKMRNVSFVYTPARTVSTLERPEISMPRDLSRQIIDHLAVAEGPVSAAEIARRHLKLTSSAGADSLVRGILSRHPQCAEEPPGQWTFRAVSAAAVWLPRVVLIVDVPAGQERAPWHWRVAAQLVRADRREAIWIGRLGDEGVEELFGRLRTHPAAAVNPSRIQRWLEAGEKVLAQPETRPDIIDLRQAFRWRLASAEQPDPEPSLVQSPARWPETLGLPGPVPDGMAGELEGAATLLETCHETSRTLEPFQAYLEAGGGRGTPVDFAPFRFRRRDVDQLPECPGIYRFLDEQGRLLYVGKAKNLRQRVQQYFLPLAAGSRRRASFLERLRDLEWTPLHSELAALVQESLEIRERRPAWNVQVEVHDDAGPDPGSLIFAVPSALVSGQFELYLLAGRSAGRLVDSVSAKASAGPPTDEMRDDLAAAFKAFFTSGGSERDDLLTLFDPPEARIVRRWHRSQQDRLHKLNIDQFSTWQAAARGFLDGLDAGDGGGSWVREAPARPAAPGSGA